MIKRVGSKNQSRERSGGGFKYAKRDADSVKKRANQTGGRFDSPFKQGIDVFRPKDGENYIRILPPTWDDAEHYGLDVWMHRFIGADNSNYLCLDKMLGKPCPACDEAKAAKAAGEDEDARQLQPQKRTLVWVIDRDDESATPQVWDMSWAQDRDIAALCENKRSGKVLLIDHPDDGYDITVKKTGKGLKTRYQFIIDRDPSPIDEDEKAQQDILDFITDNPLPSVLRYDTAEHIEKQLSGTAPSRDDDLDDDEDDKPRGKKGSKGKRARDDDDEEDERPRGRRRAAAADDDDEEEEKPSRRRAAADDDDEEEEKPSRSRRRGREEADDDDEEEEKPSRSRRRAAADDDDEADEKPARSRRRAAADDDDEEEEEQPRSRKRSRAEPEEADDDDEEEEKPRSRRRAAAADDDDEEEDDKPSRSRRRR